MSNHPFAEFESMTRALEGHSSIQDELQPQFYRVRKSSQKSIVPLRGGSNSNACKYPWRDPSFAVGDSFFKPMSKEELKSGKGRPNMPPTLKEFGIRWTINACYNQETKQYGYHCTKLA